MDRYYDSDDDDDDVHFYSAYIITCVHSKWCSRRLRRVYKGTELREKAEKFNWGRRTKCNNTLTGGVKNKNPFFVWKWLKRESFNCLATHYMAKQLDKGNPAKHSQREKSSTPAEAKVRQHQAEDWPEPTSSAQHTTSREQMVGKLMWQHPTWNPCNHSRQGMIIR